MSFHAYILRCADGSYYAGHTDNLEQRIAQHQTGETPGYTQTRRPVALAWSETFPDRDQAFAVERKIKGWSRAKKEALIAGDFEALKSLSRKTSRSEPSFDTGLRQAQPLLRMSGDASSSSIPNQNKKAALPPVIVLVRPQLGQNIGKAARAMLNFGLTEMRLVAPRDGWPNPDAGPAASGADIVLANATVFDSVAEAVADCSDVYATTVRKRGVTKPVLTPDAASRAIHAAPGRSAIVFGPERSGLESDDVAAARFIVTVPINPEFGSLNLAQAVILIAYEWSKGESLSSPPLVDMDPPAPQEELDGMIEQLESMLVPAGYYHPPERAGTTRRTLRTLLTKPAWNSNEVRTLRGVLRSLANPRQR